MADYQQNFLASLGAGYNFGQQIKQQRDTSKINQLASQSYSAAPEQRDSLLAQMAGVDAGSAFQAEKQMAYSDERRNTNMVNMARLLVNAPEQARPALYQNMVPTLSLFGLSDLPKQYDAQTTGPVIMQAAQSLVSAYSGGKANNPYDGLPADIQSLQLLRDDPELAKKDIERRQAGGMVPKLAQTAQGYGWANPGGSIDLAPMGGVAGQGGGLPQQSDMESDIRLANEMIAANIPAEMVDAFIASRGQRVQAPAAPTQAQGGGIAQPYQAPAKEESAPSGYRKTATGDLEIIPGGPADKSETPAKPMPASILRMQRESREALSVSEGLGSSIANIREQLKDGKIKLGPIQNLAYTGLNAAGQSTEASRNYQGMRSTFEKMRNDSLRLNKGVQTEGDAERAWNELLGNLNDAANVDQQLARIQEINDRAIQLHTENMDEIQAEYGARNAPGRSAAPAQAGSDFSNLWN